MRARLLARRAAEATYRWEPAAGALSEEALAMAERLADPQALRSALRARQMARAGPDGVLDRLELGGRMLALGDADRAHRTCHWILGYICGLLQRVCAGHHPFAGDTPT